MNKLNRADWNLHHADNSRITNPRILTITADWYFHKNTIHRGKYLYMYSFGDWTTYKYRFLGFCQNQYAVRIAELRRSKFEGANHE